jgi:hypothetical protein
MTTKRDRTVAQRTVTLVISALAAVVVLVPITGPAHVSAAAGWLTCKPQATLRSGIYRVDNDLFSGVHDRSCVGSTDGHDITLFSSYRPWARGVVAYPSVRVGDYYASRDRSAIFPVQVRRPGRIILHLRSAGTAGGTWLTDSDWWFYNNNLVRGHGVAELVLANRWAGYHPWCQRHLRIGRRWICAHEYKTGPHGHRWPLIGLFVDRRRHWLRVNVGHVLHRMRRLGWLKGREWLGSVAYGTEVWSGGRGLTDSMTITGGAAKRDGKR